MITIIKFNTGEDRYSKLHLLGLTNNVHLYYKDREGKHECNVIGYISHTTQLGCIDKVYETVVIRVGDRTINIAPAYLKDMQRKNFKSGL